MNTRMCTRLSYHWKKIAEFIKAVKIVLNVRSSSHRTLKYSIKMEPLWVQRGTLGFGKHMAAQPLTEHVEIPFPNSWCSIHV